MKRIAHGVILLAMLPMFVGCGRGKPRGPHDPVVVDSNSYWAVLSIYKKKHGSIAKTSEEIKRAVDSMTSKPIIDPWGNPYEIRYVGGMNYSVRSMGEDGKAHTADDRLLVISVEDEVR